MRKSHARVSRMEETGSVDELCDILQRHYCYCVSFYTRLSRVVFRVAFNIVKDKSRVSLFRATRRKYIDKSAIRATY